MHKIIPSDVYEFETETSFANWIADNPSWQVVGFRKILKGENFISRRGGKFSEVMTDEADFVGDFRFIVVPKIKYAKKLWKA